MCSIGVTQDTSIAAAGTSSAMPNAGGSAVPQVAMPRAASAAAAPTILTAGPTPTSGGAEPEFPRSTRGDRGTTQMAL